MKLFLDRRGMDFYKECPEIKVSDMENFRYVAEITPHFVVEITTHYNELKRGVYSYLNFSRYLQNGLCFACRELDGYCEPTKRAVLEYINKKCDTNFEDLEFGSFGK